MKVTAKYKLILLMIIFISWIVPVISEEDTENDWQNMSISEIDETLDQIEPGSYDFEVAEGYFDAAIKRCSSLTREQCANAYYGKGRVLNDDKDDYRGAIGCFDRALDLDPSCCQCLDQKGWSLFNLEDFDPALATIDDALRMCPSNAHIWNNKGIYYYLHYKNYQKALECFDKAIECDPSFGDAWWDKYKAHLKLGQRKEADLALIKASECGISEQDTEQEG
jgi:tetratricopeptide (TPR) repeat protein